MKKKLKTKYLAGGPPQNSYFGVSRDNTMAMSNLDSMSRGVAGAVSSLNQSQEQKQLDSFKSLGQGALNMFGKAKKGGFKYKFQTAGACPQGFAWDKASGRCLPDPNWVGSQPGVGVMAPQFTQGLQEAAEGSYRPGETTEQFLPKSLITNTEAPGSLLLRDEFKTDPNVINALSGVEPIKGNIGDQAVRAGEVTDLVEQGAPMASNKINFGKGMPGAGLIGAGLGAMATNMTSDKNAATFTRGEKAGTYASGILSGAGKGFEKAGLPGAFAGAIIGGVFAGKAAKEAENVAKGIRREEEAIGVASQEASKNSWQGQESGFAYKSSTNMNMLGTGARRMESGGVKRVPGGLIVPIKGTNAVEYIGNKHSESKIDGVSGIHIDKNTEVEHKETKQPVMMAKSGGADSSKGKMRDYFFSAYLKLGGKSFAQRHKEILAGGGSKTKIQALVQKLAQQQEAVANQNGEKDRSPSTIAPPKKINAYGGIHKYQTAGEKEEETKDETAAAPETFYEFPVENAGDETLYYNGIALQATPSLDANGKPIESQFSTPATDVGDPNKRYMKPGISRPERSGVGRKLDTNSGPWALIDKIGGRGVFRRGNQTVGSSDVYEAYDPTDTPDSERSVRRHSYLENRYPAPGDEMRESDYSKLAPIKPLDGVKPETTVNSDGSVTVRGAQAPDAVKDIDGIYRVRDRNGNVIGRSKSKEAAEAMAQNEIMALEARKAKEAAELDPAANPNKPRIYGMGRGDAASRQKYENAMIAPEDVEASRYQRFEREEGSKEGKGLTNYGWNNLPAGEKTPTNVKEATALFQKHYGSKAKDLGITDPKANAYVADYMFNTGRKPEDFLLYASGKISLSQINGKDDLSKEWNANKDEILAKINSGEISPEMLAQKRDDVARTTKPTVSPTNPNDASTAVPNPAYEATWKKRAGLILPAGYNDISGTKPPTNAEQSANAQSNSDASNVTVRDQNQANAEAPSAQESKAPGATTNNAGQAAADAAAEAGTQDATATATSKDGTPVTEPGKERFFNREDIKKGSKGVGKAIANVPPDQGDTGSFFGDVTNEQFNTFKANNPWFDFDAGFDPKKRDYTSSKGIKGSSDVARFQEEYNSYVGEGNKIQVDGKLGEQTITAMLMFTDPSTPPVVEQEKEKEKEKEVETKREPCPEGTFRSQSGECLPIPKNITTKSYWSKTAGLTQYLAPVWALLNPYEKTRGMAGVPTASTDPNPRVNLNQERATEREENIAMTNMVRNQSGIQAAIGQSFNNKQNASMLKIAQQEGNINKALIADEQDRAAKVSMFNVQNEVERQKFNRALAKEENQYAREDKLAALQQIGLVTAGNYKDMKMYEATERLADAIQVGGEYTRRKLYEALKNDPAFKGMSDSTIKDFANAYYNLTERPYEKTNANESNRNVQKLGGTRRYTSRLGELTKRKSLNFSK